MIIADSIKIDTDEGRYILVVKSTDAPLGRIDIDIHDAVLAFYASVQREIRPYVLEAESARASLGRDEEGGTFEDESGYELDDPKHPTFFERLVD